MYLKQAASAAGAPVEAEQAVGGDRDDFEEHKQIEQVAGHHHAVDAHDQDEIEQQRRIAVAQAVPQMPGAQQRDDIDAEGEEPFPRAEAQIDREWRHAAGGEHLDGRPPLWSAHRQTPEIAAIPTSATTKATAGKGLAMR